MRTISITLTSILLVLLSFTPLWADSNLEKIVVSEAQAWLSQIDNGDYVNSWNESSTLFREAINKQNWSTSLAAVRSPLGKLIGRKVAKIEESNNLPGVPDGRYIVMHFNTSFEQKKSTLETVTFTLDVDKKWRAAGYFIK